MTTSDPIIRTIAFCLVLLSGSVPAAATDNLWASWLRFKDTHTINNLYVDCWYKGGTLGSSFKLTKTNDTRLNLFELQNGRWVLLKDANFKDSYVEFHSHKSSVDVVEYFGWDHPITEQFLRYVADTIPTGAGNELHWHLEHNVVDEQGNRKLGINLDEYVILKDSWSRSERLDFREKGYFFFYEQKILEKGRLSYRFIKEKERNIVNRDEGDYTQYLTPVFLAGESYKSRKLSNKNSECSPVN